MSLGLTEGLIELFAAVSPSAVRHGNGGTAAKNRGPFGKAEPFRTSSGIAEEAIGRINIASNMDFLTLEVRFPTLGLSFQTLGNDFQTLGNDRQVLDVYLPTSGKNCQTLGNGCRMFGKDSQVLGD